MESDGGAVAGGLIAGLFGLVFAVVALALVVVMIASMWKIFDKAGKPGWAAIIPIYNLIVLLEIVEKPIWWIVLFFLPFVNAIAFILLDIELAKKFGKDALFGIGLLLLPIVFFPILAFGSARYKTSY
ncbi:MAG: signal peptidase I [Blastocatellia bacterium]|nr:signal peptidase I [Blastocatellia bacterium]MBL8194795.1 signal peptidase I [Blastocatellia bacterium]MBN8724516.1 signal peptidase I [Acidobacteriota bacterium]